VRNAHDLEPAFRDLRAFLHARETDGSSPLFSPGERLLASARRFARCPEDCARFARLVSLSSVNPVVRVAPPGEPKAVLFVGDALYAAGFAAPIEDGWYLPAHRWPDSALFQPLGPAWARPGDLLVVGGHLEVITAVSFEDRRIVTLGARPAGLVEDTSYGLRMLRARRRGDHFVHAGQNVDVLRPSIQTR
jgi:hypothetical protein